MADDEGSSQVASQPADGRARRKPTPGRSVRREVPVEERRGWLSHGLAALAISALGLAVAGSVSLTTSAQPIAAPGSTVQTSKNVQSGSTTSGAAALPGSAPAAGKQESVPADGSLAAFTRPQAVSDTSRTVQLQAAVVKERAAQRAEDLAKSAEQVSQAARDAGGAARSQELATTERATREAAVKLAQQRLAEAVRKRVAAEIERQGVENAATTTDTRPPAQGPTPRPPGST